MALLPVQMWPWVFCNSHKQEYGLLFTVKTSVLICFSCWFHRTLWTKSNLERKWFILAYRLQPIIEGRQGSGHKGILLTGLLPLSCWCFSYTFQAYLPRDSTSTVGWALLHQSVIKKGPHRHVHRLILWEQFCKWGSLFLGVSRWQHYSSQQLTTFPCGLGFTLGTASASHLHSSATPCKVTGETTKATTYNSVETLEGDSLEMPTYCLGCALFFLNDSLSTTTVASIFNFVSDKFQPCFMLAHPEVSVYGAVKDPDITWVTVSSKGHLRMHRWQHGDESLAHALWPLSVPPLGSHNLSRQACSTHRTSLMWLE